MYVTVRSGTRLRSRATNIAILCGLAAGLAPRAPAQVLPAGDDFQVNAYTTGAQAAPRVALDALGDFVVTWLSEGSSGSDTSLLSVQARRYSANGAPLDGEFQVNTYTTGSQGYPVVASAPGGDFVVAWESLGSDGGDSSNSSAQARRFTADGTPAGGEFQVNTYTTSWQWHLGVTTDPQGNFVVVWESYGSSGDDTSGFSVQAQRYAADGNALGENIQVNSHTPSHQGLASVGADGQGNFVVAWASFTSNGDDSSGLSIHARLFDAAGTPLTGEFQVNSYTTGDQSTPALAVGEQGGFVVAWTSAGSGGSDGSGRSIQAQRYAADGTPVGVEVQVNAYTTGNQHVPDVAAGPLGTFAIAWESVGSNGTDTSGTSVQARRFAADGAPLGGEFQVNSYTTGDQGLASLRTGGAGDFVVAWTSLGSGGDDTSGYSIQARRFRVPCFADGFEDGDSGRWSITVP